VKAIENYCLGVAYDSTELISSFRNTGQIAQGVKLGHLQARARAHTHGARESLISVFISYCDGIAESIARQRFGKHFRGNEYTTIGCPVLGNVTGTHLYNNSGNRFFSVWVRTASVL
jgi:hypothetical protein